MWHTLLLSSDLHHISFLLYRLSVKYRPFLILRGFLSQNHLALLKDRFLKNLLLKRAKTRCLFFVKTIGSNNSFTLIENNFRCFKIAKFEFKVTVHYSLWTKCTQLWPLKPNVIEYLVYRKQIIASEDADNYAINPFNSSIFLHLKKGHKKDFHTRNDLSIG